MRAQLDTAILLAAPEPRRTGAVRWVEDGSVLFLAHRAADGWLALDLTGEEVARFRALRNGAETEVRIVRGGRAFEDRVFALYALDVDPRCCGGLRVPASGPVQLGFGGDLAAVLRRTELEDPTKAAPRRLLLFRGLTVLSERARSVPAGASIARSTPELLFETPREVLWTEVWRIGSSSRTGRGERARQPRAELPERRSFSAYGT